MSPRVGFFVDGFNLYHSVTKVAQETSDESVRWLDLQGLAPFCNRMSDGVRLLGSSLTLSAYRVTKGGQPYLDRHLSDPVHKADDWSS
jgi:hypothetical protein